MKIEGIYIYPVKALRAVELEEAQVTKHGFHHDRRFMMLHVRKGEDGKPTYKNMAVAYYPKSVLFFPSIDTEAGVLTITYKPPNEEEKSLDLPLSPHTDDLEVVDVNLHGSPTKAYKMQQQYNDWLSSCYGFEVILTYLGPQYRPVLMSSSHNIQRKPNNNSSSSNNNASGWLSSITSTATNLLTGTSTSDPQLLTFTDVAPYLITSSKSMEDIHSRFPSTTDPSSLDIIKFRPNIIVSGASAPWDEDYWGQITIKSSTSSEATAKPTRIDCIHNCGRCKSINIDYATGEPATNEAGELLKKLQKDRRIDPGVKYSPIFGRYSFLNDGESEGNVIRKGDEVEISKRVEERTKFDWEGLNTLSSTS
ncbi:uncharacterized protein RHO25_011793 [Cercospora beticola]|uniref:MOSC domain-containing protein n=1 Tax=Cercospora beticola TaxID=122368 RepID=A0ABZ0P5I3_CERBT|nr:hypothetical protein RHO25_011793 [Cercospora beticola]CAK1367087.1 unnamed protein product [Cercospora beticola]